MGLTTTYWCDECEKPVDQRKLIKVTIERTHKKYNPLWICRDCLHKHKFVFDGPIDSERVVAS